MESMVGPIVLAQFVVNILSPLVEVAAELSRWLISNLVNNVLMQFRADVLLPFAHTHMSWGIVELYGSKALLTTGLVYLLAVWLYEEPKAAASSPPALP